jgi:hypothetical protein
MGLRMMCRHNVDGTLSTVLTADRIRQDSFVGLEALLLPSSSESLIELDQCDQLVALCLR